MAQSTPQPRPESTPTTKEETKLTGCLKEAGPSTGSPREAGSAKFILEVMPPHAGMPSVNRNPEAQRPETPDQTTRDGKKETFALMAMGKVDFSKHVNHVVELTGTKAATAGSEGPTTPNRSDASKSPSTGEPPMFHVTELRMVSPNCQQTSQ